MDISEVKKKTGLAVSKIRYYEEVGLINSTGRRGLKRLFSSDVIQKLAFITLAKNSGFSLSEIKSMINKSGDFTVNKNLLLEKAQEVENQIRRLQKMKKGLVHVSACPEANHFKCKNFIKLLDDSLKPISH